MIRLKKKGRRYMNSLKQMLLKEQKRLEAIIQKTKKQLQDAPDGTLRLSSSDNKVSYYHCTDENKKNGVYISKENKILIQALAQKSYDIKVLKCAEKRLLQIETLSRNYDDYEIENIFNREHAERKKFIHPVEPIWEQQTQAWIAEKYRGKGFKEGDPVIYTDRGERVRSKSEKILADYFDRHNIFYKYERPLHLNGFGIVYPDFTILSAKTRSEIYWEHNGRMDDPGYACKAVKKLQAYERNNIFVGEKLILTYETEQTILNTKTIEKLVSKYILDLTK